MSKGFMHECEHPGCFILTAQRYCEKHSKLHEEAARVRQQLYMQRYDRNRPEYHKLYNERWQK